MEATHAWFLPTCLTTASLAPWPAQLSLPSHENLRFLKVQFWAIFSSLSFLSPLGELTQSFITVYTQWLCTFSAQPIALLSAAHLYTSSSCSASPLRGSEVLQTPHAPAKLTCFIPLIWSHSSEQGHQSSGWRARNLEVTPAPPSPSLLMSLISLPQYAESAHFFPSHLLQL